MNKDNCKAPKQSDHAAPNGGAGGCVLLGGGGCLHLQTGLVLAQRMQRPQQLLLFVLAVAQGVFNGAQLSDVQLHALLKDRLALLGSGKLPGM